MTGGLPRIPLRAPLSASGGAETEDLMQKLQLIRQSVAQLRDENLEFEQVRDQYIIHSQQCQEDHSTLRDIFKRLRIHVDRCARSGLSAGRVGGIESVELAPTVTRHCSTIPQSAIRLRHSFRSASVVCSAQYSPDGAHIAFADGNFVYLIQSRDDEVTHTFELGEPTGHTRVLRWSRNSLLLAATGAANAILLFDVPGRAMLRRFDAHASEVSSVMFNLDDSWMISGDLDGVLIVWDVKTGDPVKRIPHSGESMTIVGMATTPEVPFYAIGFMSGTIGIYNEHFAQPMVSFSAHSEFLMGMAVSPLDETIATVSQDKSAKVWALRGAASCRHILEGHTDVVVTVTFAPAAQIMFTGSKDQSIRIWQYRTGKPLVTIEVHQNTVFGIDHHPGKNQFVSCSGDGVVCVWEYNALT
jgi:WD40 repeat protein